MAHTALARRYRPTRFSDLVAQEHVAAGLAGAVAKKRVAHAYLLTGPRGVGKTSAARILAMALNCQDPEKAPAPGEPCGTCESCARIWSGSANLDVVEIDAASNRGVDDARDLRERAMYAPSVPEGHKVYIVDEAHMLTREAWNALLKILEEPPPRVVFVFATTEPQKIANTAAPVMSRVQRFDFRRIGPRAIAERLRAVAAEESIEIEDDAVHVIAHVADGGLRDALSILDQVLAFGEGAVTAARIREAIGLIDDEKYAELLAIIVGRQSGDVFPFVASLVEAGADLVEFMNGAGDMLRALMVRLMGGQPEGLTETLRTAVDRHAEHYRAGDILRMLKLLGEAETAIRRSPNARLYVETLLLQWTLLDRTVELSDVVAALGGRGGSEPPAAVPAREVATEVATASVGASLEALEAAWQKVLEVVGQKRRMLKEALGHAKPLAVEGDVVALAVSDCEVHLEGLERGRDQVAEVIGEVLGMKRVQIEYRPADQREPSGGPPAVRLNRDSHNEERLRHLGEKDPTLKSVVEALDLEVME